MTTSAKKSKLAATSQCALCALLDQSNAEKPTVCVGSRRSVKLQACRQSLQGAEIVAAPEFASSVSDWPIGLAETFKGARHRAQMALRLCPTAHFGLGIESGFRERKEGDEDDPWVVYVCVVLVIKSTAESVEGISDDLDTPITATQRRTQIQEALLRAISVHHCSKQTSAAAAAETC